MKITKKNTKTKELPIAQDRQKAVQQAFEKYFDRLYAYAFVITHSESRAKDAVSEVFFNLWNSGRAIEDITHLEGYLFVAVKNQAVREASSDLAGFESFGYDQATRLIERINPEDLLIGQELEAFIAKVVDELPPQCRVVFRMIREENKKYKEVAEELGLSPSTVKHHLITAVRKIREALEEHFDEASILHISSYTASYTGLAVLLLQLFQ